MQHLLIVMPNLFSAQSEKLRDSSIFQVHKKKPTRISYKSETGGLTEGSQIFILKQSL